MRRVVNGVRYDTQKGVVVGFNPLSRIRFFPTASFVF